MNEPKGFLLALGSSTEIFELILLCRRICYQSSDGPNAT